MPKPKIIVINNNVPIRQAIDFVWENDMFQNHLQYWEAYLTKKQFQTVSSKDVYSKTRNLIGLHICLEGNIVFMDTSSSYGDDRTGMVYLPANCKTGRKKLISLLTSEYQQLSIFYDIKPCGASIHCKEKEIIRPYSTKGKVKCMERVC